MARRLELSIDRAQDPALARERLQDAHHSRRKYAAVLIDDLGTGSKYPNRVLEILETAALMDVPSILYSDAQETRQQAIDLKTAYPCWRLKVLDDSGRECPEKEAAKTEDKKGPEHCLADMIENALDEILRAA